MKKLLLFITAALLSAAALCQDFPEKFDNAEMDIKTYNKDTSAHALVLKEFGKAWISSQDDMPLVYEYHVRIKIFDSKAFDEGNVSIRLYHSDGDKFETIRDIKAVTYYKDEQGLVRKTELDREKIYNEMSDKNHQRVKFALPNLREGCIIEYSYITESPYRFNFHTWNFQSNIPKLYSEFEAHIPAIYDYNVALRGFLKLSKNKADLERDCFSYYGVKADCSNITYAMSDIPAFVAESHMTAPVNYVSALYFELSSYTDQHGVKKKVTQQWKDIDYTLKTDATFGGQMKRTDMMKDRIPPNILSIADTLTKAKAVYGYLQKWFKWNNGYGIYSDDIKKTMQNHTGSVADINLSLIAALNAVGIYTEAVALSTRDRGVVDKLFPVLSDFDYVVARINVNGKSYLLDATDPLLTFGMLPLRCINDQGRVLSLKKPSFWIDLVQTQKLSTTTSLDLTLQADGKIKGSVVMYSSGYAAYEKRHQIKKFNSVEEYVENLDEKLNKLKILKSDILNIDSLDLPVVEKYEVQMNGFKNLDGESFAFDPAFWSQKTQNPFKLSERNYPVDIGSISDHKLILTLHYPDNLVISSKPAPVALAMPKNGGRFISSFDSTDSTLSYSQVEQLNKAIYMPEEYPYLKELYNKIIQNQKATVVFKKKI